MNEFYGGIHWSKRTKVADMYHQAVFYATRGIVSDKTTSFKYPVSVRYDFYYDSRLPDVDNLPVKLINDGLRIAGILKNDDPKHISEIRVRVAKGKIDEVCIEIIEDKLL